jgi:hypothetical protein
MSRKFVLYCLDPSVCIMRTLGIASLCPPGTVLVVKRAAWFMVMKFVKKLGGMLDAAVNARPDGSCSEMTAAVNLPIMFFSIQCSTRKCEKRIFSRNISQVKAW